MKKVIVLGATGGTGTAIVEELLNRGITTIAFGRSLTKLNQLKQKLGNSELLTLHVGNAFDDRSIYEASKDADVIFQCVAVPYEEMEKSQLTLGKAVMTAADKLGKKIVFVDGIYPYGRATKKFVDEEHTKNPHTKKGKIKLELEKLILSDQFKKAMPLIARLPDYYGPSSNLNSYLGMTLLNISKGKLSSYIGSLNITREYIYLPDAAKMIVELAGNSRAYRQNWNIPGNIITGRMFVHLAKVASGTNKSVIPLNKTIIRMIGWFSPVMREMVEMSYLTETPVYLDGNKYNQQIGPIIQTPFEIGIPRTIQALKEI
ncbi:NAD-dependent epimerase/dehydratase family protein [Heyndrickxia oleronia]|uniref:SDR family NAD(P)-dependent oxidoreductase n=1 Tax=Heyndrickxia oleronia TaxID=38875 RepID=A0AAW6T3X0_9BACI|nr:NAD-dependent epimerase/dehydratase family protein [Heyndrickxia oleronia]MDH5163994.1 SDR family NAD(P)-dependent oxidoreductase [Heyndrickxia oleronia]